MSASPVAEHRFQIALFIVLRIGVVIAAALVALGGAVYLSKRMGTHADFHIFNGEPADLRSVGGIMADARSGSGRGLIQLGLLLLIATPIMRVLVSVVGFALERDGKFVVITAIVLALLAYSLFT